MHLAKDEREMLDGKQGPARQKAMELLVKYGEALGAEKFIDTNNAHIAVGGFPFMKEFASQDGDAIYSEFYLDSRERVIIPRVRAYTTTHVSAMDPENWQLLGADPAYYELNVIMEKLCSRVGINFTATCTPYQIGNVPVKGEHCAWMESSAVPYCNAVLGARTNTEGCESSGATALTGKIPLWGFHIEENRLGTHLVNVEIQPQTVMDWDLMGYYVGEIVQLAVPVYSGIKQIPELTQLKSHGAALASSGGVEMYHIVGITPEAPTMKKAFGKNKPLMTFNFAEKERRTAYEHLNSATDTNVDLVVLGCPHHSIDQIWHAVTLLDGRQVHTNTELWIWTARQIKALADRMGYTDMISKSGGHLLTDTCPCVSQLYPKGTKVVATDSCKQAHYTPAIAGHETWYGSPEDCIEAAITGKWKGGLQ
jgi:predicted aconitase